MDCQTLCERLDTELETAAYADVDASANGLQVESSREEIAHVAVAVDAAVETIERAALADADLLVTHHGISWGGIDRVTDVAYKRLDALFSHDLPLYVSHLPLDGHQKLGNAAQIAEILELEDRKPFGEHGGVPVGQQGRLPDAVAVETLAERLAPHLDIGGQPIQTLAFGSEPVTDVAIVTGSGVDFLGDASDAADVLLTGEGKQHAYHEAKERELNLLLGGHYATETFGVKAVASLLEQWGLETTFIDCPTGL